MGGEAIAVDNGVATVEEPLILQSIEEIEEEEEDNKNSIDIRKTMQLNEAFVALEAMRQANLEVEFAGMEGLEDKELLSEYCTECLYEEKNRPKGDGPMAFVGNIFKGQRPTCPSCFVCATPVCPRHSCPEQANNGLHICGKNCRPLLDADGFKEHLETLKGNDRQHFVAHAMESYDRSLLLLQYACQFEDLGQLANSMEHNSRKHTHLQLGGSGMGFLAGVTGVGAMAGPAAAAAHITAAATLLSPVGPGLLMASLVLGGAGAAAAVGHELTIHKFYASSEEQQRYRKLLAWHAVVTTLASVVGLLKQPEKETMDSTEASLEAKNRKVLLHHDTDSTESMTEWSEDNSLEGVDEFGEGKSESSQEEELENEEARADEDVVTETDDLSSIQQEQEEQQEAKQISGEEDILNSDHDDQHIYSLADIDDDDDDDEPTREEVEKECGSDASEETPATEAETVSVEEDDDDDEPTTKEVEKELDTDASEETPVTEAETASVEEEQGDSEVEPLVAAEDAAVSKEQKEEMVETVDSSEDLEHASDKALTNNQDGRKHPLTCMMPLAPLLDDAVLSVCKVFSDPRAGARVAMHRTATNAVKVANYASVACGALSALTIFFEAYNIDRGLKRLDGPCNHAEKVRNLNAQVEDFPDTKEIARALEDYLGRMGEQQQVTSK